MLISDDQIGLFPFEAEESEQYRAWVNQEEFTSLLGRCLPVTESQHDAWYQSITQSPNSAVFAVKTRSDQRYLGNVWLHNIHWINRNAELRIFLGGAQGKGFGTRASKLLLRFAFEKLGLHKVYLFVSTANPRACRSFEKAGFTEEGVLIDEFFLDGTFVDVKRMAVRNVAGRLSE
jgi:RimJ/RimL family protein N-acetyltransferase